MISGNLSIMYGMKGPNIAIVTACTTSTHNIGAAARIIQYGDADVMIAGGAETVRQYLAAGSLDELYLHVVPVLLGTGERLLEDVGDPVLDPVQVVASPAVTHIRYRVARRPR